MDTEKCNFCEERSADYGFDFEWDAFLCWRCHLEQQFMMWFLRTRYFKTLDFMKGNKNEAS